MRTKPCAIGNFSQDQGGSAMAGTGFAQKQHTEALRFSSKSCLGTRIVALLSRVARV